ncbi:MAG: acyltransferase family protein, partial [Myxococcota bacterium]
MSTPTTRPRLLELDALRGIAAMAVVLFHYTSHFQRTLDLHPFKGFPDHLHNPGRYGVELFFILS